MKNRLSVLLLMMLFISTLVNAQISIYDAVQTGKEIAKDEKKDGELEPKLVQTAEFGISLPTEIDYDYTNGDINDGFTSKELKRRLSFDLIYNIGYPVFKKFTMGAMAGIQHQSQGSVSALKLGGSLRYYLKNYEGLNFYLTLDRAIGISSNVKDDPNNVGVLAGLQFPIKELTDFDNFRVVMNLFIKQDSFDLKEPLIQNEKPFNIVYRKAYGISIGLQF